jgi:ABC-type transport system involved in multi-copper enzyme maturation permease subunit
MSHYCPTWQEATAGGLWLAGAAGLFWLGPELSLLERAILSIILLVGLLIILRRFWSWLLGPLFFYDLVRTARRNRLIPIRCLFALALLAVVFLFYVSWFDFRVESWQDLFSPQSVRLDRLAAFGSSMFSVFFGMLYLAGFLLTPIYTAGAIAEEKERRTLDLLLTTALTNREIVVGLLASRLATLGLIFLTILPMLSLMEFLGGVDPKLVLAGFVISGVGMFSVGCVCMLVSLYVKSRTSAIVSGYFYSAMLGACWIPTGFVLPSHPNQLYLTGVLSAVMSGYLACALLFFATLRLRKAGRGEEPWPVPPGGFRHPGEMPYSSRFPGFREVFPDHDSAMEVDWPLNRPPVTDSPVFWKETSSFKLATELNVNLLCFLAFVVWLCCGIDFEEHFGNQDPLVKELASLAISMMIFPVGFLSSRTIAKEHEGRTLDMLVMTALYSKEILLGKRNACVLRIRWTFFFFAGMGGLAVLNAAIHLASYLLLILAAVVYLAFFANLGLFISTCCKTRLKAMLIFTVAFLASGLGITVHLTPIYLYSGFIP